MKRPRITITTDIWKTKATLERALERVGVIKIVIANFLLLGIIFGSQTSITITIAIAMAIMGLIIILSHRKHEREEKEAKE